MTNKDYEKFASRHAPRSNMRRDLPGAFTVGGLICCVGQLFIDMYSRLGFSAENAAAAETVTMVFLGALLTGIGVYDDLARFAGAGTLVPITGFANAVASPALEFKTEGFITGTGTKMFVIAGPVIVYGVSAGIFYGLILALAGGISG